MRKKTVMIAIVLMLGFLLVTWLPCQADDNVIYGCYKKNNGQLRIVSDHSKCRPSELPISWGGSCDNGIVAKLACVTGSITKGSEGNGDIEVDVTHEQNISISEWSEVFDAYIIPSPDEPWGYEWGLLCKDDWTNTGCSQKTDFHLSTVDIWAENLFDLDIRQSDNGCRGDNEEYLFVTIYTTCCRIIYD